MNSPVTEEATGAARASHSSQRGGVGTLVALSSLCVAILGAAYILRGCPLNGDECGVLRTSLGPESRAFGRETTTWLARTVTQALGVQSVDGLHTALVLVSMMYSVATLTAVGVLAQRLASARVAYVAVVSCAVLHEVSVQVTGVRLIYSTSLAFSGWALVAFVDWIEGDEPERRLPRLAVLCALALATHRVTGPLLPVCIVTGLALGRPLRALLRPRALAGLALWGASAVWFIVIWPHGHAGAHAQPTISWTSLLFALRALGLAFPVLAGAAAVGAVLRWRGSRPVRAVTIVAALYVVAVALVLSRLTARYFLHVLPIVVALALMAFSELAAAVRDRRWGRTAAVTALLIVAVGAEAAVREGIDAVRRGVAPIEAWTTRLTDGFGPRRSPHLAGLRARLRVQGHEFDVWGSDELPLAWYYLGGEGRRFRPTPDWTRAELDAVLRSAASAPSHEDATHTRVLLVLTGFLRGRHVPRLDEWLGPDPALTLRDRGAHHDAWLLEIPRRTPNAPK